MTALKQIQDKLNKDLPIHFPRMYNDLDIGDYTFNSVENIDEDGFVYLYSSIIQMLNCYTMRTEIQ